ARAGFKVLIPEATTNVIGYRLLQAGQVNEAIEVFRRNVDTYPHSANVYDSLGEALERAGQLDAARDNYQRAFAIGRESGDPNTNIYKTNAERVARK
ncbi:MAG TPA: tetratricopeptide repeat protein, partial [Thermoanaerobaculia bacterium]|nr:tetratricopeptide repeat protein [Thermoanaerobaculia bacterium]